MSTRMYYVTFDLGGQTYTISLPDLGLESDQVIAQANALVANLIAAVSQRASQSVTIVARDADKAK